MSETAILPPPEALAPARELAAASKTRWAGESAEYRKARIALLEEEIALRRQIERVAQHRRAERHSGAELANRDRRQADRA